VGEEVAIKDKMHQNAMVIERANVAQARIPVRAEIARQLNPRSWSLPKREDMRRRRSTNS